ncbi:hypothetical protein [Aeromonas media]|uniref:hypothetical protein n=1 Tax=Aeromonas media TaxID=651 RepID=UPI0038E0C288
MPIPLLHIVEKNAFEGPTALSLSTGLGNREHLLKVLAELDHQRSRLAQMQGHLLLKSAQGEQSAAQGVAVGSGDGRYAE